MPVVLAYSPSPAGPAAFRAAVEESRRRAVPLLLVNASVNASPVDAEGVGSAALETLSNEAREAGVEVEVLTPDVQDLADGVVALAAEHRAEVLVIGIRHRSAIGKLLLGSTAQRIILDATCPVLAVKSDA